RRGRLLFAARCRSGDDRHSRTGRDRLRAALKGCSRAESPPKIITRKEFGAVHQKVVDIGFPVVKMESCCSAAKKAACEDYPTPGENIMSIKPEDFAKSGVNFALAFANTTFDGVERLALLNLAAARSVFEVSVSNLTSLLGAKDVQSFVDLQKTLSAPSI